MRVHIGGDHAAYDLKCTLVTFLQSKGYDVVDHGPGFFDAEDDYPVAVLRAAEAASGDLGAFGIVLGGSGLPWPTTSSLPSWRGRTTTPRFCPSERG